MKYVNPKTEVLGRFVDSVIAEAASAGTAFDSASSIQAFTSKLHCDKFPEQIQAVMDNLPDDQKHVVFDSVLSGCETYKQEQGVYPNADVIESALYQGLTVTSKFLKEKNMTAFDSVGTSNNHDPISSQPNRAAIAITSAIVEAIPFASYLPADIGSNESRLIIMNHQAGTETGEYAEGDNIDGINCGSEYLASERRVSVTLNAYRTEGDAEITAITGDTSEACKLLRGRTGVYINGLLAAAESPNVSTAVTSSPLSGVLTISGTDYTTSGTVNVNTGVVALAFSPALPSGTTVEVEGYIDFEKQPELTPSVVTQAQGYPLYARPWRGLVRVSVDAQTQYANETGVDLKSECLMAVRAQYGMERHYTALKKLKTVAAKNGNTDTFDMDWSNQGLQKTRSLVVQDLKAVLSRRDQKMANDTMDCGGSIIYVTDNMVGQITTLGSDYFVPSGVPARPSIYRLGRLFGMYDVYYTPRILTDADTNTSQMLLIGVSSQVARNPIVMADAVAPMYKPLGTGDDMKEGVALYARNLTDVNPHVPSALHCALITVTNINS